MMRNSEKEKLSRFCLMFFVHGEKLSAREDIGSGLGMLLEASESSLILLR